MNVPIITALPQSTNQLAPSPRLWTRDEYYRLVKLNFFDQERVELLWGKVIAMPPMLGAHAMSIGLTEEALESAFGTGHWVRTQSPLDLALDSVPEPDLAVVVGGPRNYPNHPTSALLIVEISESTLRSDRETKGPLYASANQQEYWIVNLVDRQLEVYHHPQPDASDPQNSRYAQLTTVTSGQSIAPLAAPNSPINVDDLLP